MRDGAVGPAAAASTGARISLGIGAAEKAFGANSFPMQTARGSVDRVGVSTELIPADKDAFRSRVLASLGVTMKDDAGFLAALRAGQVTVQTADEVPERNIQPVLSVSMDRDSIHPAGGNFAPPGTNICLSGAPGRTRGQPAGGLGNGRVVAHWPRPG